MAWAYSPRSRSDRFARFSRRFVGPTSGRSGLVASLGVRRAIIRRELLREYTVLGIASGVLGVVLALLSTVWILPAVFDLPWVPPVGELLLIAAGVALIVIGSAWWGLRSVYRISTAAVLRKLVDS